ncbi:PKD domain-containing protein [Algoriphagus hitonicola]|uniref:PKD domain-containing protein n=1 Tax=Algoriphagus hitonicola TaxID=435880 RepID=UPI003617CD92
MIIKLSDDPEPNLLAVAGEDRTVEIGNSLALNGAASILGGEQVQILWENVSKPENSSVTIENPTLIETTFSPTKAGDYVFKLSLILGESTSQDLVKITVLENSSNQGPILINEDILEDRTLTNVFVSEPEKLDYLVTSDVAVRGAKLTIEPGVRVGFEDGAGLMIAENASLKAYTMLTETLPIIFQGKEAQKGYWDGIKILSKNPPEYLVGIEVRDAGKLGYGIQVGSGAKLFLSNSTIHINDGIGLDFQINSQLAEFKNNQIKENTIAPLQIPASLMTYVSFDNQFQDGAIQIIEGKILSGVDNFWPTFQVEYDVLDELVIYNGSTLVLSTGAHLNMGNDQGIRVISGGKLRILGEETAPVVIEGKTKAKGAWRGIYITDSQGAVSSIMFAKIKHAGSTPIAGQDAATIKLGNGAGLKVVKTILDEGKGHGLEAAATNLTIEFSQNIIQNHLKNPLSISAQVVEHLDYYNKFENNGENEVLVDGFHPLAKDGGEIVWKGFQQRIPYVIKGLSKDLVIQSGMRLKEGVTIKMQPNSRIDVQDANGRLGYLRIEGNEGNPVIIRGVGEEAGSWYGITYSTNHAQNHIQYAEIFHAGRLLANNFSAAITVDNVPQGSLLIQNSRIAYSGQHGIAVAKQFIDLLRTSDLTFEGIPGSEISAWE